MPSAADAVAVIVAATGSEPLRLRYLPGLGEFSRGFGAAVLPEWPRYSYRPSGGCPLPGSLSHALPRPWPAHVAHPGRKEIGVVETHQHPSPKARESPRYSEVNGITRWTSPVASLPRRPPLIANGPRRTNVNRRCALIIYGLGIFISGYPALPGASSPPTGAGGRGVRLALIQEQKAFSGEEVIQPNATKVLPAGILKAYGEMARGFQLKKPALITANWAPGYSTTQPWRDDSGSKNGFLFRPDADKDLLNAFPGHRYNNRPSPNEVYFLRRARKIPSGYRVDLLCYIISSNNPKGSFQGNSDGVSHFVDNWVPGTKGRWLLKSRVLIPLPRIGDTTEIDSAALRAQETAFNEAEAAGKVIGKSSLE